MAITLVNTCARDRSAAPDEMLAALDILRAERPRPPTRNSFGGTWELVWNDKIAKVPLVNGYMPNKELLTWNLKGGVLDLSVETIPFLPEIKIRGENLTYANSVLTYTVGDKSPSTWDVFHADGDVVCAVSSATGVNVIRRITGLITSASQLPATGVLSATQSESARIFPEDLNLIYDSKCGVCQWEVDFLRSRDSEGRLTYTDLESEDFEENVPRNGYLDYETALASFHAVKADGTLLKGMPVFQEAYAAVGLGWVWNVYNNPLAARFFDLGYSIFAKYRTDLTRGSSLEALYAARRVARAGEPCPQAPLDSLL